LRGASKGGKELFWGGVQSGSTRGGRFWNGGANVRGAQFDLGKLFNSGSKSGLKEKSGLALLILEWKWGGQKWVSKLPGCEEYAGGWQPSGTVREDIENEKFWGGGVKSGYKLSREL